MISMAARRECRAPNSLMVLLLVSLLISFSSNCVGAAALTTSRSEQGQAISSGSWAVVAQGRNQPITLSPYVLNWTVSGGTAFDYFHVRNVGSLMLHSVRVVVTQVRLTGNANSQEIFFELCLGGGWDVSTNLCSGTILEIGRSSNLSFNLSQLNLGAGSSLEVRARTRPNNQSTFETTLTTQVTRADSRPRQVSHS